MYEIEFYDDEKGREPVKEFILELSHKSKTNKNARINFTKIMAYIEALVQHGTFVGEPITKYLDSGIWELRPLRDRILYAFYKDNIFIFQHQFTKKTQKTPTREIEQAKRNLQSYLERHGK